MTETRAIYTAADDLGPVALDLIVKWSKADTAVSLATNGAELDAAFIERRAVQGSMRGLANQIEALRLGEENLNICDECDSASDDLADLPMCLDTVCPDCYREHLRDCPDYRYKRDVDDWADARYSELKDTGKLR